MRTVPGNRGVSSPGGARGFDGGTARKRSWGVLAGKGPVAGRWVKAAGRIDAPDTLAALQIESIKTVTKPALPYEY